MKQKYDYIFSLGEACLCATMLNKLGLRQFSSPFDWLYGSSFAGRIDILLNDFVNWLDMNDLVFKSQRSYPEPCDIYTNTHTGIVFNHDFPLNVPLEQSFDSVNKKYNRRICRCIRTIKKSKKVLIVFMTLPDNQEKITDSILDNTAKKLNKHFNHSGIDIMYIKHDENMSDGKFTQRHIGKHVVLYTCFNRNRNASVEHTGNWNNIKLIFNDIQCKQDWILTFFYKIYKFARRIRKLFYCKGTHNGTEYVRILGVKFITKKPKYDIKDMLPIIGEYYQTKTEFGQCCDTVSTIVLGSSHARRAFVPEYYAKNSFNLATTSQDLYQSFKMLVYATSVAHKIKNVILFCSTFSSGYDIQHSSEKYRSVLFNIVFNASPQHIFDSDCQILYSNLRGIAPQFNSVVPCNKGFYPLYGSIVQSNDECKERALKHYNFGKDTSQIIWLNKIYELCLQHNIRLVLVTPPTSVRYRAFIPAKTWSEYAKFARARHLKYKLYVDLDDFTDNDFYNCDHLNYDGAVKFTKKLKKEITSKQ